MRKRYSRSYTVLSFLTMFSYREQPFVCLFFFGAGDEARTRYLDLGKVALYQMSYARKRKVDYSV